MSLEMLEKSVERKTGIPVAELRQMTISEMRCRVEHEKKHPMEFYSAFPLIGRGNVMRDCVISHADIERELDEVLL
jgi:hypothetical protein